MFTQGLAGDHPHPPMDPSTKRKLPHQREWTAQAALGPKSDQKANSPTGGSGVPLTMPLGAWLPGGTSEVMAKHNTERHLTREVGAPK